MFHFRSGKMSQAGADVCSGCPPGKYSGSRAAECITCSPGRYTRNAESAVCSLCPVGQFSREHGKSECVACPAGKYQQESGTTSCKDSPAGAFSESEATSYSLCEDTDKKGSWSREGSESCNACIENFFYDNRVDECIEADMGINCTDKFNVIGSLTIRKHYYRFSNESIGTYRCRSLSCDMKYLLFV